MVDDLRGEGKSDLMGRKAKCTAHLMNPENPALNPSPDLPQPK